MPEEVKKKKVKKKIPADTAEDRAAMGELAKDVEVIGPVTPKELFSMDKEIDKLVSDQPKKAPYVPKKSEYEAKPSYFITLFHLKGHQTWRIDVSADEKGFERDASKNMPKAVVTETMKYKIDRLSGEITKI